jgi:hypothetical protein
VSTHDEVLDAIDQTLRDYEVSDDAMRWTPEPPPRRSGGRVYFRPTGAGGFSSGDWAPLGTTTGLNWAPAAEAVSEFQGHLNTFANAYTTAMQQIKVTFTATVKSMAALYAAFGIEPPAIKARRSACWSEYHRRQKRRNR